MDSSGSVSLSFASALVSGGAVIHSCGRAREGLDICGGEDGVVVVSVVVIVVVFVVGRRVVRRGVVVVGLVVFIVGVGIVGGVVVVVHFVRLFFKFVTVSVTECERFWHLLVASHGAHTLNHVVWHWEGGPVVSVDT